MKKILLLVCLFVALPLFAAIRTPQEAIQVVCSMHSPSGAAFAPAADRLQVVDTLLQTDLQTPAMYVVQRELNRGFVLVSAETNTTAVVGYSDSGEWDWENAPANLRFWMNRYVQQISRSQRALSHRAASVAEQSSSVYPTVEPLIHTVWNQLSPYNCQCPMLGGRHTPTGCVATAMGQVMYKHRYPQHGVGQHSYLWNNQTLSVDFAAATYAWNLMPLDCTDASSAAEKNAVGQLLYHLGVAFDMDYDLDGSGTMSGLAMQALIRYFGYDADIRPMMLDYHGEQAVLDAIAADLQAGRPVFFSGATRNQEGHAFVCEGMQEDGYLYLNWGWGGVANGYYALTLMDPSMQGVGGSATDDAFTEGVVAYTRIRPNAGGTTIPLITADELRAHCSARLGKTDDIVFGLLSLANPGLKDWEGGLYFVIYDTDNQIVGGYNVSDFGLDVNMFLGTEIELDCHLQSLAPGDYQLSLGVTETGQNIAYPIYLRGMGEVRIPVTVTADSIFLEIEGEEPPGNTFSFFTHTQFAHLMDSNEWSLDMCTPTFWSAASHGEDALVRCTFYSGSEQSVVGSYRLDRQNTRLPGTISTDNILYAYGQSSSCYMFEPTALEMTFLPLADNSLRVDYCLDAGGELKTGSDTIVPAEQEWLVEQGGYYYNNAQNCSYELATPMPIATALAIGAALQPESRSPIPYILKGVVALPEADEQADAYRFVLQDATASTPLSCRAMTWLHADGLQLQAGDSVVIWAYVGQDAQGVYAEGCLLQRTSSLSTACSADDASADCYKFIRDGHLYIRRGNRIYSILGGRMNDE